MKKAILPVLAFLIIIGCKKEDSTVIAPTLIYSNSSNLVTYTEKKDVNVASVHPEALTYYKNIATIADWYAAHPTYNKTQTSAIDGDTSNTLLAKISALTILDSNNAQKTIFEISPAERKEFLETWALIEARDLSEKLKLDTSNNSLNLISERNVVFNQTFGANKTLNNEDPYWKLRHAMDLNEKKKFNSVPHTSHTFNKTMSSESDFYATAVANGILGCAMLGAAPLHLPVQTFVDRIKASFQPGRLLIALPGGNNLFYPVVFYPNADWYDPGHVAIISVSTWQIGTIKDRDILSIGTNSKDGMHPEYIADSWASIHGLAYVGQVYDTKWVTKWVNVPFGWWTVKVPTYVQEARDINNNAMFNEALALLGKPYCHSYELLTAKWAAPARFICSTTAWWCAKKSAGVNIGDFYKSTIFPAGVFTSDRVRIVGSTY